MLSNASNALSLKHPDMGFDWTRGSRVPLESFPFPFKVSKKQGSKARSHELHIAGGSLLVSLQVRTAQTCRKSHCEALQGVFEAFSRLEGVFQSEDVFDDFLMSSSKSSSKSSWRAQCGAQSETTTRHEEQASMGAIELQSVDEEKVAANAVRFQEISRRSSHLSSSFYHDFYEMS